MKVNLSFNLINRVGLDAFINLQHLACVDLSNNQIILLDQIIFCSNCAVTLHLEQNPVLVLLLNGELPNAGRTSVYFSGSGIASINFQRHPGRFNVILNNEHDAILAKPNGNMEFDFLCGEEDFPQLNNLLIDKNQFENLSTLLQYVGPKIVTMELSGNKLGSLNHTTFQRFTSFEAIIFVQYSAGKI